MRRTVFTALLMASVTFLWLIGNISAGKAYATQTPPPRQSVETTAQGYVYVDQNENGRRDEGEAGLPKVGVSNGTEIVETDSDGLYRLPLSDDQAVFVIKPSGYRTRLNRDQLPQFYYIHKPEGSPKLQYPGVAPTGPLPASIDFPLYPQQEPSQFKALLFGDPQPRNLKEVGYIAEDVIADLVGTDATFGVTLGDIVFDDLSCFPAVNETYGLLGIPWYNVIGNHDINYDVEDRKWANETFEATYGPSYYSFNYGNVHFVVTDNINYHVDPADGRKKYNAKFGETQLQFIQNDLSRVPDNQLVVLMMHIPLQDTQDRRGLYRLIEKRPFSLSISGHTHFHAHRLIGSEDGWRGDKPHHHIINVTVSGSWWGGQADERGIPHTVMCDGAPNGYSIIQFDDHNYQLDFVPAGRPKSYQMHLNLPDEVAVSRVAETALVVNVFNAAPDDQVEARIGVDGSWHAMNNFSGLSPSFVEMFQRDRKENGDPNLPSPRATQHLWKLPIDKMSEGLPPGHYLVQVRWTDRNGQVSIGNRVLRVISNPVDETTSLQPAG